jgi:hypothetical protein
MVAGRRKLVPGRTIWADVPKLKAVMTSHLFLLHVFLVRSRLLLLATTLTTGTRRQTHQVLGVQPNVPKGVHPFEKTIALQVGPQTRLQSVNETRQMERVVEVQVQSS